MAVPDSAARASGDPVAALAAVLREVGGPLRLEQIELALPGPGQVLVRIDATGICHSDLSLANGTLKQPLPAVLGHEGTGWVEAVGTDVSTVVVGDRVVLSWTPACRECWWCRHDEPYLCPQAEQPRAAPYARLADGTAVHPGLGVAAFGTATLVPAAACIQVPADLPPAVASVLGCAVLTGVGAVRRAAGVGSGESVLVVGLGGVGLSAVLGARLAGADPIIAVDPVPAARELATRIGAAHVLEAVDSRQIRALTGGRGADHAVECVGSAATIRAAWSATRRGGKTTVVGLGRADDEVRLGALELAYFGRTLAGCMYGSTDPLRELPELVAAYRAGQLDLAALIGREIALEELPQVFARPGVGPAGRTVVRMP